MGETKHHLGAKEGVYNTLIWAERYFDARIHSVETEKSFGAVVADVYFEFGDKQVIVEIQHSKITKEEIDRRMVEHSGAGRYVLWVRPYMIRGKRGRPRPVVEKSSDIKHRLFGILDGYVAVSEWELYLQKMYSGRVFYVLANTDFAGTVVPVHWYLDSTHGDVEDVYRVSVGCARSSVAAKFFFSDWGRSESNGAAHLGYRLWEDADSHWWRTPAEIRNKIDDLNHLEMMRQMKLNPPGLGRRAGK